MTVNVCLDKKNFFITGGTGFIGKCLLEKLLRSVPNIGNIYLLLRSKKGKTSEERLSTFFDDPLFDKLRESFPEFAKKISIIDGDLQKPKLGISEENRKILIDNVNVIYHSAASIRFDVPLIAAILTNVRSTRDLAELALEAKYLDVFIHISSTYGNSDKDVVEERLYPSHGDWREAIRLAEEGDRTIAEYLTQKYIYPLPNTYLYAKAITEHVVNDLCRGKIPAAIVRPSIVTNIIVEPIPGWTDNLNGPVGLMFAGASELLICQVDLKRFPSLSPVASTSSTCTLIGPEATNKIVLHSKSGFKLLEHLIKGILRVLLGEKKSYLDVVPVDAVANFLILVAVESLENPIMEEMKFFNISKHYNYKVDLDSMLTHGKEQIWRGPINEMIWFPRQTLVKSRLQYRLLAMLYHILPAILIDGLLRISGKKPRLFQMQKRIFIAQLVLEPFMMKSWTFKNEKSMAVEKILTDEEVPIFGFKERITLVYTNKFEHFVNSCIGLQKYLFQQEVDLEKNKKKLKRFWVLSIITRTLFYIFLIWFVLRSDILGVLYKRVENYMSSL